MFNETNIRSMGRAAKKAAILMGTSSIQKRNKALSIMIKELESNREHILQANRQDMAAAAANGLSPALLERLSLEHRLDGIIEGIKEIICLEDPIGEYFDEKILPNKLKLAKRRIPLGVIGVIYESRPDVTIDISLLTIKTGNCVILRGGSETLMTNQILVDIIKSSLATAKLPVDAVQLLATSNRDDVKELLQMHEYIDVIIPRGGAGLQQYCREHSTIPVITGGIGICHLYVDETANLERSLEVVLNAKTQRPTVCNALDTLLVHSEIAPRFIGRVVEVLKQKEVEFRLDTKAMKQVNDASCRLAVDEDWDKEWLSLTLGIKVVENMQEAIEHIRQHGTGHSDGILTENDENGEIFIKEIDSAAVYINASTRFTDGGQFGMGGEVAISTQKLHARGPMGLKELTSYKWVIRGNYQVRN